MEDGNPPIGAADCHPAFAGADGGPRLEVERSRVKRSTVVVLPEAMPDMTARIVRAPAGVLEECSAVVVSAAGVGAGGGLA